MRYFLELAYNGAPFIGWQKQPGQKSVQQCLEDALSTLLQTPTEPTGCGRTDTGVHARRYFAHFDFEGEIPENFFPRINFLLPEDVAVYRFIPVDAEAHARYDAIRRGYEYQVVFRKDPFLTQQAYYFPFFKKTDFEKMQEAARLLLNYREFATFCKTNHDAKTMECDLFRSEWLLDEANHRMTYYISANRFLRGMVRLIVGMCINVGLGKIDLETVKEALDKQEILVRAESAPAHGLFLTEVEYPFL